MIHNLAHPKDKHNMWPQHIFTYKYRDWPYDKKKILDCIYAEAEKQEKDIDSDIAIGVKTPGLKESKFDFLKRKDQYPILDKIGEFMSEAVADVISHGLPSIDPEYKLDDSVKQISPILFESWYHITNGGGFHGAHCHPGASWAGIFYVQSSECALNTNNGINRWFNVNSNLGPGDLGSVWNAGNSVFSVPPEEGTLAVFPAWLWHDATPYTGKEDRVIISFNSVTTSPDHYEHNSTR